MTPAQWTHSMQESSLAAMDNYHNECKSHKDTQMQFKRKKKKKKPTSIFKRTTLTAVSVTFDM